MSHTVKITTTTTTNSTSALVLNTGYLKTVPGLLKFTELILGIVCVGLTAWYYNHYYNINNTAILFFLLMATTFLISTFCLLLSCVVSWSTGGLISKTMFELIYHSVAFVLILAASITLMVRVNNRYNYNDKDAYFAASVLGLINSILYLVSAFYAQRSYRGF